MRSISGSAALKATDQYNLPAQLLGLWPCSMLGLGQASCWVTTTFQTRLQKTLGVKESPSTAQLKQEAHETDQELLSLERAFLGTI